MFQTLYSEKNAADAAFTGWRKMLSKAVHPKNGEVLTNSIEERLKSLDAAWRRFDEAHYSLIQSSVSNIPEFDREEEQKVWESRLEEYCIAREEGLEVLKKNGVDLKAFEKLQINDESKKPEERETVTPPPKYKSSGVETPPPVYESVVISRHLKKESHSGHGGKTSGHAKKSILDRRESKTSVGCFHRPRLPDEVLKNSAVRDDLVISGHKDFNSLYASNDTVQQSFTVNILGAPNDSTTTCGCDNINCPFCNLVTSIRKRDPSLYD